MVLQFVEQQLAESEASTSVYSPTATARTSSGGGGGKCPPVAVLDTLLLRARCPAATCMLCIHAVHRLSPGVSNRLMRSVAAAGKFGKFKMGKVGRS